MPDNEKTTPEEGAGKKKGDKLPAFQFYPGDWRKDPGIQAMDFEERGVWFELLCIMHESEDRGRLVMNSLPIPIRRLAKLLGISAKKTEKFFKVFTELGVCSVDENGAFFNRRMVREEGKRQAKSRAGKAGMRSRWGDGVDNESDNTEITEPVTEDITNGGSSSSSSSSKPITPLPPQAGEAENGIEKPPPNSRAAGTSPRQIAGKKAEEEKQRRELEARVAKEIDDAWHEVNAVGHGEYVESLPPAEREKYLQRLSLVSPKAAKRLMDKLGISDSCNVEDEVVI